MAPKKQHPIIIRVVPLTPLFKRRDPFFDYGSDEEIAPGTLVSIPFGSRILPGIVWSLLREREEVSPKGLKKIHSVLLPEYLGPKQLALARALSERLFVPLSSILKLFLPLTHRPRKKEDSAPFPHSLRHQERGRKYVFTREALSHESDLWKTLSQAVLRNKKRGGVLLILYPEVLSVYLISEMLQHTFPKEHIIALTSQETPVQTFALHEAIRSLPSSIIIGTRQALFAPFSRLHEILVVDPEKHLSYTQWERYPRYDATDTARLLGELFSCPTRFLSVAPDLDFFVEKKSFGKAFSFCPDHALVTINLRKSRPGHATPFAEDTLRLLRTALYQKDHVLIVARQRGISRLSFCAKCKSLFRCPKCETALSEKAPGHYRCLQCQYESPLFPHCPTCQSLSFQSLGSGTRGIEQALRQMDEKISPIIIDRDELGKKASFQKLIDSLTIKNRDTPFVIVSTYDTGTSLPFDQFALIVLLEPESPLFFPEYRAEEKLWVTLRRFGSKLRIGGTIVTQTFQPEAKYWTRWIEDPLDITAQQFLEERSLLHYPPLYNFIRLDCSLPHLASSRILAQNCVQFLRRRLVSPVEILPPYLPYQRKKGYYVLVRYPAVWEVPAPLRESLINLDPRIRITLHPLSLNT